MQRLRIQNIPNQIFNITLDGIAYTIRLRSIDRFGVQQTLMDISVNGLPVKSSIRCVPDEPLIPYEYLTADGANFFFHCLDNNYPWYENFNITQVLCYGTKAELEALWA